MTDIDTALSPEIHRIFAGCLTSVDVDVRFKNLAKVVHPDRSRDPRANDAFTNLNKMRERAVKEMESGVWTGFGENTVTFTTSSAAVAYSYLKKRNGDLGDEYVSETHLACVLPNEPFVRKGVDLMNNIISYAPDNILENARKYVPVETRLFKSPLINGKQLVTIERDAASAALEDVVNKWGPWDPRSVAWLVSSLCDFTCFLSTQKIVHLALTPQNVFVNTEKHSVQVVGGWWFFKPRNATVERVPNWVHSSVPNSLFTKKRADVRIDLESVKALARYCLKGVKDVPRAMDIWLSTPSCDDAVQEYFKWERAREVAFGVRKFVDFGHPAAEAYKKEK